VVKDFVYPNRLAFSPDESQLYINDTRQNLIKVYEVNKGGTVKNGRLFCNLATNLHFGDDDWRGLYITAYTSV
jgi:gluconolactonase